MEYQVEPKATIYPRIFMEMSGYQLEHMDREVRGILIFINEQSDPKLHNWWDLSQGCGKAFQVVYLEEVIEELPEDHPLAATFKPLVESNRKSLGQHASNYLKVIRNAPLQPDQKIALEDVFLSWLTQRFKNASKKEIIAMFGLETPVEETVFFKEVFHEGKVEGKVEGKIEGEIKAKIECFCKEIVSYRELYEQGHLPQPIYEEKVRTLQQACARLQQQLDKLNREQDEGQ